MIIPYFLDNEGDINFIFNKKMHWIGGELLSPMEYRLKGINELTIKELNKLFKSHEFLYKGYIILDINNMVIQEII